MSTASTLESRRVMLPGGPLDYALRRSPRSRHLRVTIDPRHGVVVALPPATRRGWARPEGDIERFLAEREPWLRRHLGRLATQREAMASRGGVRDGAEFRYLGELHVLRIVAGGSRTRRSSVARHGADSGDELHIAIAAADRRSPSAVLEAWLRAKARVEIELAVERHAAALSVAPSRIALRDTRTRWGSASRKGTLSFSWRLILAPPDALDTVVVHELAHLRVFGHGPRFWDIVAGRRPDHATWRRWLRAHSHELHAALAPGEDHAAG